MGTMRLETLARKIRTAREGVDDALHSLGRLGDEGRQELHPSVVERLMAAQEELSKAEHLLAETELRDGRSSPTAS
jgi:hypothetical protein